MELVKMFSDTLVSEGVVTVSDKTVPAVHVRNLYGQDIVWGMFGHSRGKFKGFLANNANTEEVYYKSNDGYEIKWLPAFKG